MDKKMKTVQKRIGNKGFSLVELIVVIAIMAALMAILAPKYIQYVEKTRQQADKTAVSEVIHAAELAMADEDVYTEVTGRTDDTVVTIPDGKDITTSAGTDKLKEEITSVITSNIDFKSKKFNGATYEIVIDKDGTVTQYQDYESTQKPGGWTNVDTSK